MAVGGSPLLEAFVEGLARAGGFVAIDLPASGDEWKAMGLPATAHVLSGAPGGAGRVSVARAISYASTIASLPGQAVALGLGPTRLSTVEWSGERGKEGAGAEAPVRWELSLDVMPPE